MRARFAGVCVLCETPIKPCDEIENVAAPVGNISPAYAHVDCPPEPMHGTVCPGCHLEKSLDGSCDCPDQDRKPLGIRPLAYQERT